MVITDLIGTRCLVSGTAQDRRRILAPGESTGHRNYRAQELADSSGALSGLQRLRGKTQDPPDQSAPQHTSPRP